MSDDTGEERGGGDATPGETAEEPATASETTGEGDTEPADERVEGDTTLAALAHASALVASFFGPLLFLILADEDDELVKRNAKNALNFQIVVFVALVISGLLTVVLVGLLLIPLIAVIDLVLVLIATVKANDGQVYEYPYTPDII
jgi:uncharacterized Tic20 family protein